ncbi:hypothetical protein PV326_002208 [Microctonus aethiopoides]|nr:hypothetical protein PV326_002208 [Microctonus aethiopoides]
MEAVWLYTLRNISTVNRSYVETSSLQLAENPMHECNSDNPQPNLGQYRSIYCGISIHVEMVISGGVQNIQCTILLLIIEHMEIVRYKCTDRFRNCYDPGGLYGCNASMSTSNRSILHSTPTCGNYLYGYCI